MGARECGGKFTMLLSNIQPLCYTINMSIKPKCDKCQNELLDFGGILLSPPSMDSKVVKYHLCQECCAEVESKLKI